jgi:hypothetical protein
VSSLIEVPDLIERRASCHNAKGHTRSGGARGELETQAVLSPSPLIPRWFTPQRVNQQMMRAAINSLFSSVAWIETSSASRSKSDVMSLDFPSASSRKRTSVSRKNLRIWTLLGIAFPTFFGRWQFLRQHDDD